MREIENAIWDSPDARNSVKPLIVWMLRQTEGFTKRVALSLRTSDHTDEFIMDFLHTPHDMVSCNGNTKIDSFSKKFSTEVGIRAHSGYFCVVDGETIFTTERLERNVWGGTVWISYFWYDHHPEVLEFPGTEVLAQIVRAQA